MGRGRLSRCGENLVESAWRRSLERAIDVIAEGILIVDKDGRIAYVNSATEKMLGLERSGITGKSFGKLYERVTDEGGKPIPPEKTPIAIALREAKAIYGFKHIHVRPDGTRALFLASAVPFYDERGNPTGAVASFTDITERERAERELKESESRFRSLAESATDAIICCVKQGTIISFWNKAAEKVFGYSAEETIGKPTSLIIPEKHRKAHREGVQRLIATGKSKVVGKILELEGLRKDGREFPIEFSYGSWRSGTGEPLFVAIVRDITERKRAENLSSSLDRINTLIHSTLDVDQIMKRVVVDATDAIGAESALILLHEADRWIAKYAHGLPEDILGRRFTDRQARLAGSAVATGKIVVIPDAEKDKRINRELVEKYNIRSALAAPLVAKDEVIGALFFYYHSAPIAFTDAQADFANKLAASVSLAVENARLYESKRDIADTLQEALLVMPDRVEGIEFGCLYHSATEAAEVGGDFYDIFELEEGRIGLAIGDISGKGLEAATLNAFVKSTIRAYVYEYESPALIMSRVNETLGKTSAPSVFASAFFGILDTASGNLTYCNAGHPPPILVQGKSGAAFLPVSSPVIGAFSGMEYAEGGTLLKTGDLLFLYTDGAIEARQNLDFFGEDRLLKLVSERSAQEAKRIAESVFDEIMRFTGGHLADDVALLAIALSAS